MVYEYGKKYNPECTVYEYGEKCTQECMVYEYGEKCNQGKGEKQLQELNNVELYVLFKISAFYSI